MTANGKFVGFGFGAIQGGLFLYEAFRSGNFNRLVVAEVVPETVEAVRCSKGRYSVNVATKKGIEQHMVEGIEIFNPVVTGDRAQLEQAVSEATEIACSNCARSAATVGLKISMPSTICCSMPSLVATLTR